MHTRPTMYRAFTVAIALLAGGCAATEAQDSASEELRAAPMQAPLKLTCRVVTAEADNPWLTIVRGWTTTDDGDDYGLASADEDSQSVRLETDAAGTFTRLSIGEHSWLPSATTVLNVAQGTSGSRSYSALDSGNLVEVKLDAMDRGVVEYQSAGAASAKTMATIDCSSTKIVLGARAGHANVKRMYAADRRQSQAIIDNLDKVDFAYEMDDGYYSVKRARYYKVLESATSNEVVGYIKEALMSYSEGDDETAVVRFDRNGLRLGELQTY